MLVALELEENIPGHTPGVRVQQKMSPEGTTLLAHCRVTTGCDPLKQENNLIGSGMVFSMNRLWLHAENSLSCISRHFPLPKVSG